MPDRKTRTKKKIYASWREWVGWMETNCGTEESYITPKDMTLVFQELCNETGFKYEVYIGSGGLEINATRIKVPRILTQPQNFLEYNNLDTEVRLLFRRWIDRQIEIAVSILKKYIVSVNTLKHDQPYFSEKDALTLHGFFVEILEMLGASPWNNRFGTEAIEQHHFFKKRPAERNNFYWYFFMSLFETTKTQLSKKEGNKDRIDKNMEKKLPVCSMKVFKDIPDAKKIRYWQSRLSISEMRAVCALYMINFIRTEILEAPTLLRDLKSQTISIPEPIHKIIVSIMSLLDGHELMISQSEGGKSGNKGERFDEFWCMLEELVKQNPSPPANIIFENVTSKLCPIFKAASKKTPANSSIKRRISSLRKKFVK